MAAPLAARLLRAAVVVALAASPARAAFDGMTYRLDPATNVLSGFNDVCRVEVKEVRVVEVNGLYALSGNTFPYAVFFIKAELERDGRPVYNLYALLGNTYLRESPQPCRALTVLVARHVSSLRPKRSGEPVWKFSELYDVGFEPGAAVPLFKLDQELEAGTARLSAQLDAGR